MNASRMLIGLASAVIGLTPLAAAAQQTGGAFGDDDRVVVAIRALPEPDLKEFYLRCARAALQQSLSVMEIAYCSFGYEELVRRIFRNDFDAFVAWSQAQDTTEASLERSELAKRSRR